ncbi:MAG: hypothetical protein IJ025_05945 [Clostridia bacterium]|nr:hypothetical protein [Clostridia bacterium]
MKMNLKSMTNMKSEDVAKVGAAAMAVGVAAAVTAGVISSRNSTKNKMKKIAKKTVKNMDGVVSAMQSMFK